MRNVLPLFFMLLVGASLFAKQSPSGDNLDPFANKIAVSYYPGDAIEMPITLEKVVAYLQTQLPNLASEGVTLELVAHKTSPGGEHYTFDQYFQGQPVFHSQVKVNLGLNGRVYSIFDNSYNTAEWPLGLVSDVTILNNTQVAERLALVTGYKQANIEEHAVIAVIDGKPAAYKWLKLYDAASNDNRLYLLDTDGAIVYNYDLNVYSGVPATAYVFNPDPITSAQTIYLAPYVDSLNSNTLVLRDERVSVNIEVEKVGSMYYLQNSHFVMADFSSPSQTVVSSPTPNFFYTRTDSAFEEVNAYYHLNIYQTYVDGLGYIALTQEQIQVDAHGLNGYDNSQFSTGGGTYRLSFGDGGVDDAEDADVIVHEYAHSLSYAGSPATNFGNERSALDEGYGDYFAASYSRSLSPYKWDSIFSWDGHNEYWVGRTASTSKIYPGALGSSIHRNGEMWSTALMQVWGAFGQEVADKLALESLFGLASNMTFTDAAWVYLQADSALYGGAHYNAIFNIMVNRGFIGGVGIQSVGNASKPGFALINSYGFTFNGEAAVLENYTNQPFSITVYDISGKVINQLESLTGSTYYLSGQQLTSGTYLIKVSAGSSTQTFKLVK